MDACVLLVVQSLLLAKVRKLLIILLIIKSQTVDTEKKRRCTCWGKRLSKRGEYSYQQSLALVNVKVRFIHIAKP